MRIGKMIGTLACTAVLGAGITTAAAGPASAGGCTLNYLCGVVVNNTPHQIQLCWAWDGPRNSCYGDKIDHVPGNDHRGGDGKDVDAFYVPDGHCFDWDVNGVPAPNARPGWHQIHNGETATVHRILGC